MKKIGKKTRPVKNPKRIIKPLEAPEIFEPKKAPVEEPAKVPVEIGLGEQK